MPRKTSPSTYPLPTIEQLTALFERRKRTEQMRIALSPTSDLPRVPYAVVAVDSDNPAVVAHFREHFRDPDEVRGKLTLSLPDSMRQRARLPKTKKPSRK